MEAELPSSLDNHLKEISMQSSSSSTESPVQSSVLEVKSAHAFNGVNGINAVQVATNGHAPLEDSISEAIGLMNGKQEVTMVSSQLDIKSITRVEAHLVQQPLLNVRNEPIEALDSDHGNQPLPMQIEKSFVPMHSEQTTSHGESVESMAIAHSNIEATDSSDHSILPEAEDLQLEEPMASALTLSEPAPTPASTILAISAPPLAMNESTPIESATQKAASSSPVLPASTREDTPELPPSPGKVSRERDEEEVEDGPAAKRLRADESSEFKRPTPPALLTETRDVEMSNTTPEAPSIDYAAIEGVPNAYQDPTYAQPLTQPQTKFLLKTMVNLKRQKDAVAFLVPVDFEAMKLTDYLERIKSPMDLKTVEEKLKAGLYTKVLDFLIDFNQMVQNTNIYNGPIHVVSQQGQRLQASMDKHLPHLPSPDVAEAPTAAKKARKPSTVAPKPKREPRVSVSSAKTPTSASSAQTFALGPSGIPTIRRDSAATDGRPRREIHPPPPRDLPYSNQKPKKKKFQWELKFCQEILVEMKKAKYSTVSWPFMAPVDPVAQNIPNYHSVIKKPMDLGTVETKLKSGEYENAKEFEADVRLVFQNCFKFNPASHDIHQWGKQLEEVFDDKLDGKRAWIEKNAPSSGVQSPRSSPDPDDEEDDDDDDDDDDDEDDNTGGDDQLSILQKQIAAMSKQVEMITKNKKSTPPTPHRKHSKNSKPGKKAGKRTSSMSAPKGSKKEKDKSIKKSPKVPYVTYEQKQDISSRINTLPEARMNSALNMIRENMPNLQGAQEDEIELDIDELPNEVLYKLLQFVRRYAPLPTDEPLPRASTLSAPMATTRPKKNKPMSKTEQEAKIKEIRGRLQNITNATEDTSPEPKSHAKEDDTSGDDDDSEESEED